MKESINRSLSSMNYIFLREAFEKNKEESEIRVIILEELTLFLGSISKEEWSEEFKEIVRTELDEGSYLEDENLNIKDIEEKFSKTIKHILYEEDIKLVSKYMEIVKEIKNK